MINKRKMSEELHKNLLSIFIEKIIYILLNPITNYLRIYHVEPLTLNKANDFILENLDLIKDCVKIMIENYEVDDYLEELNNPDEEWIIDALIDSDDLFENIKNAFH